MNETVDEPAIDNSANIAKGRLRPRAKAGIAVFMIFLVIAAVLLAYRATAILELYRRGLRRDAILLLTARDVSLAIVVCSFGFLLSSLIHYRGKLRPIVSAIVLILGACSCGVSANAEQGMRLRIQNNLEHLRRAIEEYQDRERSSGLPTARQPEGN